MFLHSYAHARFLREFCTSLRQLLASGPSLTDINLQGNAFPRRKWRVANEGWREWRRISTESLMPSRQRRGSSSCTDAEDQVVSGDPSSSPCGKMLICVISRYQAAAPGRTSWKIFKSVAFLLPSWHTCNAISSKTDVIFHVWIMLLYHCLGPWCKQIR